jgi:hypothetical protein
LFPSPFNLERNESMAIDPLSQVDKTAVVGDPARKLNQHIQYEHENRPADKTAGDPVSVSLQRASSTMGKLGVYNEEKILMAKNIRETDSALQGISDTVDRMKVNLEKIVKNWPPFSPDSSERKAYLMSCVSLRKEIVKMTVPPPPKPVYEKNKIVWDNLGAHDGGKFSVPEISDSSTDAQVKTALGKLYELGSKIAAGRKDLILNVTG